MIKLIYLFTFVFTIISNTSWAESTSEPDQNFRENFDYQLISPPQPTQSKGKRIEVVEMFFYACPHCYKLEPTITKWLKNKADDIDFIRIPAIIGPTWVVQAKAFYIAKKLNILDKVHPALFDAIHKDGNQIYNEYSLMQFFSKLGVNENKVAALFESDEINELASQARVKTVKYGIRGVPAIIVNGKYYTATYFSRDHQKMLKIVDYLIDKERRDINKTTQLNNQK